MPYGFLAACIIPTLVLTLVIIIWPVLDALYTSFTNAASARITDTTKFVGFDNYIYLFTKDMEFRTALWNTVKLMLVVPVTTIFLSLFFAFLLTQTRLKERGAYRVLFFLPSIISLTVVAIVWSFIFNPRADGIANRVVQFFGGQPVEWMGDERYALWCIAIVLIWQAIGYYMVMHIAAIDGISTDIYEAAAIDGANQSVKFTRITVPLLRDIIGITFVLSLSGTINLSYVLSSVMAGTSKHARVLLLYMYQQAFGGSANFGYAMTITVFSLVMAFVLSMLSRKVSYRTEKGR